MLTRLLVTMLVSQVPEGNPIALSAKKATSARDAGVKTTLAWRTQASRWSRMPV
jgi:hypothetical protein